METSRREDQKERLHWNEAEMAKSAKNVAIRLKEIHDEKLWECSYDSFEDYCQRRLRFSLRTAQRVMQAQTMREMLTDSSQSVENQDNEATNLTPDDLSDHAVRELKKTPEPAKILKEIAKTGDKPTAKRVRLEVSPEQEVKVCPTCKRPL